MKWGKMGTVKLFKLFLRRKANGAAPCEEFSILSPVRESSSSSLSQFMVPL